MYDVILTLCLILAAALAGFFLQTTSAHCIFQIFRVTPILSKLKAVCLGRLLPTVSSDVSFHWDIPLN